MWYLVLIEQVDVTDIVLSQQDGMMIVLGKGGMGVFFGNGKGS